MIQSVLELFSWSVGHMGLGYRRMVRADEDGVPCALRWHSPILVWGRRRRKELERRTSTRGESIESGTQREGGIQVRDHSALPRVEEDSA